MIEAIKALQYEGTPAENALNFKEQGNEMVKEKRWKDAKEFYTKGLATLNKKIGKDAEDEQQEKAVEEACLINRALCNLNLQNYRATTLDCAAVLRLNAKNLKAYYRCAQAFYALKKLDEAHDAALHGMIVDKDNQSLRDMLEKVSAESQKQKKALTKREQEQQFEATTKNAVAMALYARNLRIKRTDKPPELEDAVIHLSPDPTSPESHLQFPVTILYPMHAQSDFIKAVSETDTMGQHLDYLLPLPWDTNHEYATPELYADTTAGGLTKVGRKVSLLEILVKGDVAIVDELVTIYVIPKTKAAGWILEMKKRQGK